MSKFQTESIPYSKVALSEEVDTPLINRKMEDLFYTVRDEIQNQVEKLKVKHERFLDLVRNTNTGTSEFKELRKGMVKDIRNAEKNMSALEGSVDMVEKNRPKFPQIKDPELASRKKIVKNLKDSINDVKTSMDSTAVRRKLEDDENRSNRSAYDENVKGMGTVERENTQFISDQKLQVKDQIKQQDKALDNLGKAVDKLEVIGRDINQELSEQNVMIGKLENEIDDAQDRMNVVQAALSKLLKTKDGCMIWTIVILAVILVILVALVIWT